jgi:hypothetical protein
MSQHREEHRVQYREVHEQPAEASEIASDVIGWMSDRAFDLASVNSSVADGAARVTEPLFRDDEAIDTPVSHRFASTKQSEHDVLLKAESVLRDAHAVLSTTETSSEALLDATFTAAPHANDQPDPTASQSTTRDVPPAPLPSAQAEATWRHDATPDRSATDLPDGGCGPLPAASESATQHRSSDIATDQSYQAPQAITEATCRDTNPPPPPEHVAAERRKRQTLNTASPVSHAEWLAKKLADENTEADRRAEERQAVAPWWPSGVSRRKPTSPEPHPKHVGGEVERERHVMSVIERRQKADEAFTDWLREREKRRAVDERAVAQVANRKAAEERAKRCAVTEQSGRAYGEWLTKKNSQSAQRDMELAARKASKTQESQRRRDLANEAYARWKRVAPARPRASATTWVNPRPWVPIEVPPHDPEACTDVGPLAMRKQSSPKKSKVKTVPKRSAGGTKKKKKYPSPPLLYRMHELGIRQR